MNQSDVKNLSFPQSSIKVYVDFYNEAEKQKLLQYPTADRMTDLVANGVSIPIEEFLTYYLFHKQRLEKKGWRTYEDLGKNIGKSLEDLEDWITFDGDSIRTPMDVVEQDKSITERIGESIGLSVVSRIHGLTAADWKRIPPRTFKAFDFSLASDGSHIIQMDGSHLVQLEAKGRSVDDNTKKKSISSAKSSIHEKKRKIAELTEQGTYEYPADIRYGTITAMDPELPVKCWLVDPPADGDGSNARKFRLLCRMEFLTEWISFISPRSQFSSALQTRLTTMKKLEDPFVLENIPLVKGNGEPFKFQQSGSSYNKIANFFYGKAKTTRWSGISAGGVSLPLDESNLFFIGITEQLLEHAYKQNFERLIDSKDESQVVEQNVTCKLPKRLAAQRGLLDELESRSYKSGEYITFDLKGKLHSSDAGIVYGVLPIVERY